MGMKFMKKINELLFGWIESLSEMLENIFKL